MMTLGKYWDLKNKQKRLYEVELLEFYIPDCGSDRKDILNNFISFLSSHSDIDITNGDVIWYTRDVGGYKVVLNYPYKNLEQPVKDYLLLLEDKELLEWL